MFNSPKELLNNIKSLGFRLNLVTRLQPGNASPEALPPVGAGGRASTHSIPRWNLGTSHELQINTEGRTDFCKRGTD
jgi:hypothetical protein